MIRLFLADGNFLAHEALRTAVQKTGYDADELTADARAYGRLPDCCKKTNAVH